MRLIAQGVHSRVYEPLPADLPAALQDATISRPMEVSPAPLSRLRIAVKVVDEVNAVMVPHDVRREIDVLQRIRHVNIIDLIHAEHDTVNHKHLLYLPYLPLPLSTLLSSPYFSPAPPPSPFLDTPLPSLYPLHPGPDPWSPLPHPRPTLFHLCAKSIAYQLISAVAYLHALDPPIAHRDVKPGNVMLGWEGVVKLIDFGTISEGGVEGEGGEDGGRMVCQVGTGAYRAPELLFGPITYNPLPIDLWSLGAALSTFFTPFLSSPPSSSPSIDVDAISDTSSSALEGFCLPRPQTPDSDEEEEQGWMGIGGGRVWKRMSLFEGGMGDLGLAGSVFRIKGTPTDLNWPEFKQLPDADKISFFPTLPTALSRLLSFATPSAVNLIEKLLEYSPERRMTAKECLEHEWFKEGLCLPDEVRAAYGDDRCGGVEGGLSLGEAIRGFIPKNDII